MPLKPATHVQVYTSARRALVVESEHVAPFMHGADRHSSISASQLKPVYPAPHTHAYENTPSTHVDPLAHGYDEHSSRWMSHVVPAQPSTHTHDHWNRHAAYVHGPSTHVEPFMHGDDEHS